MLSVGDGVGGAAAAAGGAAAGRGGGGGAGGGRSPGVGVDGALRRLVERTGAERAGLLVAIAFAGTVIGGDASPADTEETADGEAAAATVGAALLDAGCCWRLGPLPGVWVRGLQWPLKPMARPPQG